MVTAEETLRSFSFPPKLLAKSNDAPLREQTVDITAIIKDKFRSGGLLFILKLFALYRIWVVAVVSNIISL